ncbi:hypothetical protein QEZ47_02085 [Aminobacter anthyllidis]|uniref:hypothetical protein n=1 Tax=Aminobacter anthyllidis TaxID=1035067 RepID=UPI00245738DC|nr:hypothetical protein [Aminobacter anthyllidis]MDH4984370.1 hypothetical protein [Aminobacter anthyllidis]
MIYSVQQIKFEIYSYIQALSDNFDDWYIGIASDPISKLESTHNVSLADDFWLYKQAVSAAACKSIHEYFVRKLNVDGCDIEECLVDMDCVYLFKKGPRTKPRASA